MPLRLLLIALSAAATGACGAETPAADHDPNRLTIVFEPTTNDAGDCYPTRTVHAHADTDVYRMEARSRYRRADRTISSLPAQAIFHGIEGWRESRSIGPDLEGACAEITIDLSRFECMSMSREDIDCPAIEIRGAEAFAGIVTQ